MYSKTIWEALQAEAKVWSENEPSMRVFLKKTICDKGSVQEVLVDYLSCKLHNCCDSIDKKAIFLEAFEGDSKIIKLAIADLTAILERDPACRHYLTPILFFKGFHSITSYRVANYYWYQGRKELARYFQSLISESYNVDIHPAAKIGGGVLLDHACGFVAGETCVIEDNVSILHEVTLGGTGKEQGDRHPKIKSNVLIGAGAKVLGNVTIGVGARIAACSVVLRDVAPHVTVAGIPAKEVGEAVVSHPENQMEHYFGEGI